jgi:hypothetical protein
VLSASVLLQNVTNAAATRKTAQKRAAAAAINQKQIARLFASFPSSLPIYRLAGWK